MNTTKFFDSNNYQYNPESRDGVYIIHGFTNTTYEVKELARYIGDQGYYAVAHNLPGHGTTPEDCNRCKYTNWIEFVEQGVADMSSRCDNIYVIGISMGAVLALHLSSIFPLNAVVVASPVLKFKDYISTRILTPLFHRLIPFREKRKSYPKAVRDKYNYLGYQVWPLTAVNEMRKLTNQVKKSLPAVKCPALVIHSTADMLSIPENVSLIYGNISSEIKEKLIVTQAGHNLFISNPEQDLIFRKITSFFNQFQGN